MKRNWQYLLLLITIILPVWAYGAPVYTIVNQLSVKGVTSEDCVGTSATGTIISATCGGGAGASTTINGAEGPFNFTNNNSSTLEITDTTSGSSSTINFNLKVPAFDFSTSTQGVERLQHSFNNFAGNASFEHWLEGTSTVPTGWVNQSATFARVTSSSVGTYGAAATFNALDDAIYQAIGTGASVWHTCSVFYKKISGTGTATIVLQENGDDFTEYGEAVGLSLTQTSTWNWALVSAQIPDDGTNNVRCKIAQSDSTGTDTVWYLDEYMFQEGKNLANGWLPRYIDDTYDNQHIYGSKIFDGIVNASNTVNLDSGLNVRVGETAVQGLTFTNATGSIVTATVLISGISVSTGMTFNNGTTTGNFQAATLGVSGASTLATIITGGDTIDEFAGRHLTVDGSNDLNVDSELASSSIPFGFYDATTTAPYSYSPAVFIPFGLTITSFNCAEFASATSTVSIYQVPGVTSTPAQADSTVNAGINCGISGNSTTSFVDATVPAGKYLLFVTTSTLGVPTFTQGNLIGTKDD